MQRPHLASLFQDSLPAKLQKLSRLHPGVCFPTALQHPTDWGPDEAFLAAPALRLHPVWRQPLKRVLFHLLDSGIPGQGWGRS